MTLMIKVRRAVDVYCPITDSETIFYRLFSPSKGQTHIRVWNGLIEDDNEVESWASILSEKHNLTTFRKALLRVLWDAEKERERWQD